MIIREDQELTLEVDVLKLASAPNPPAHSPSSGVDWLQRNARGVAIPPVTVVIPLVGPTYAAAASRSQSDAQQNSSNDNEELPHRPLIIIHFPVGCPGSDRVASIWSLCGRLSSLAKAQECLWLPESSGFVEARHELVLELRW